MAVRGRPKKNGAQPGWMLGRVILVLHGYNEARRSGEKHSTAVRAAIDNVKKFHPEIPISETEVKRILVSWQPRGVPIAFNVIRNPEPVTLPDAVREWLGLPEGVKFTTYSFGYGPRQQYRRHNRRLPSNDGT